MNFHYNMDDGSYLMHYGVLGMKWGVRNEETLRKYGKASTKRRKGLSDKQKLAIKVGVAAIGIGLAAYGGYKLSNKLAMKNVLDTGVKAVNHVFETNQVSSNVEGMFPKSPKEIIATVNKTAKGHENCAAVGIAHTLQMKGINAVANPTKAIRFDDMMRGFPGAKSISVGPSSNDSVRQERIMKNLLKQARGESSAYGVLEFTPKAEYQRHGTEKGAHIVSWIVNDGRISITDAPGGTPNEYSVEKLAKMMSSNKEFRIASLHNASPNLSYLKGMGWVDFKD